MVRGLTDRYTYFLISRVMVSSSGIKKVSLCHCDKSLSRMHEEFCICIRLRISLRPTSLPSTPPRTGTLITCRFNHLGRLPEVISENLIKGNLCGDFATIPHILPKAYWKSIHFSQCPASSVKISDKKSVGLSAWW